MPKVNKFFLSRALIDGPYIALVTTEAQFKAVMKHLKVTKSDRATLKWLGKGACATVTTLESSSIGLCCIVAVSLEIAAAKPLHEVIDTLAHEATHVWQNFSEAIGDTGQSKEFEAYCIGKTTGKLFKAFRKELKAWKRKQKQEQVAFGAEE